MAPVRFVAGAALAGAGLAWALGRTVARPLVDRVFGGDGDEGFTAPAKDERPLHSVNGHAVDSAAEAASAAVAEPQERDAPAAAPEPAASTDEPEPPIEGYEDLPLEDVVARLETLDQDALIEVEDWERAHRARRPVLERIAVLREQLARPRR